MPDIHIDRAHELPPEQVQDLLRRWIAEGEEKYGLSCHLEAASDDAEQGGARVHFERPGVKGVLTAAPGRFVLDADLGFLFRAFAPAITRQIELNLDELLAGGARPT